MLARAARRSLLPLVLVGAALAGAGCPAGTPVNVAATTTPAPTGDAETTIGGKAEGRVSASTIFQIIEGSLVAPVALADGKPQVEGLRIDEIEAGNAAFRAPAFRVTQAEATAAEVPVNLGLVSVRGYDLRTIPELPSLYTSDGDFYFTNVPSKIAFFLEANVETRERSFQLLGLTRTEETGKITKVRIDVASTLVARELMRMWQISGYRVSFKDLDPRDFNPLLLRLRKHIQNGLPAGVFFDPSKVAAPDGDWSFEKDKKDSALVALDQIASREEVISREIDRLYLAVNYSITHVRDTSRVVIPRPPSLQGPAPTPTPGATQAPPTPRPTQAPQKMITVTGKITGTTAALKLHFKPDLTRDDDGADVMTTTAADGTYSVKLPVGAVDGAAYYEVYFVGDDASESLGGAFRVFQDGQTAPDIPAPAAPV
jgi:hypothetical protein